MAKTIPERSNVPAEHRWNLASLFSDDSEWERELVTFNAMILDAERAGSLLVQIGRPFSKYSRPLKNI